MTANIHYCALAIQRQRCVLTIHDFCSNPVAPRFGHESPDIERRMPRIVSDVLAHLEGPTYLHDHQALRAIDGRDFRLERLLICRIRFC